MAKPEVGVLVMSYGTPESMEQIKEYYTHIRRGRPPAEEQLRELTDRYEAIAGGVFPLRQNTDHQVKALEATLRRFDPEVRYVCYQGLKHARPYIEDGIRRMVEDGIRQAVGIVLAPHYSAMSVGAYIQRAAEAAEPYGLDIRFVKNYHLHPELIAAWSDRVRDALTRFEPGEAVRVLFSAHSLPEKILEMNDPYPEQLLETSRRVAGQAGVDDWQFVWQSAGRTAMPWLGPDILEQLRTMREQKGVRNVLVCPVGFVSDHLEVLYDIDIECKHLAQELGMHLERTASLNDDPRYMTALADSVLGCLQKGEDA